MALKPLAVLPTPKVPKATISVGKGPAPWYLAGPAADVPGYIPPGGPGYVPPGGGNTLAQVPGTGTGPITPSYKLELTSDPLYQQVMDSFSGALSGARSSLRDQIRNAVIQSGYDIRNQIPSDLGDYAADIDPATAAAAAGNQLSGRAQLQQALDRGRSNLDYSLAARGVLRSGAEATGQTDLQQQYQTQSNSQMQSLLDAIRGGVGGYTNLVSDQTSARNAALEQIASRLAALQGPTYDGGGGGGESYVPPSGLSSAPSGLEVPTAPVQPVFNLRMQAAAEAAAARAKQARKAAAKPKYNPLSSRF